MGAPKQKWTSEEEAALRAGVHKHGVSQWRTILKDPEFSNILRLRSNVDIKDKWRNMSVAANGFGSRSKSKSVLKKTNSALLAVSVKQEHNCNIEILSPQPLAALPQPLQIAAPKKPFSRIDDLILEAIRTKEPAGTLKTAIMKYIEDNYQAPPDFTNLLSDGLRDLLTSGRLIEVKRKYRIAPCPLISGGQIKAEPTEANRKDPFRSQRDNLEPQLKFEYHADLSCMKNMTLEEAAAFASRCIAEAETASAAAEEAAGQLEIAQAMAEESQAFLEAVIVMIEEGTLGSQATFHPSQEPFFWRNHGIA